jgi:hypothetical protein
MARLNFKKSISIENDTEKIDDLIFYLSQREGEIKEKESELLRLNNIILEANSKIDLYKIKNEKQLKNADSKLLK